MEKVVNGAVLNKSETKRGIQNKKAAHGSTFGLCAAFIFCRVFTCFRFLFVYFFPLEKTHHFRCGVGNLCLDKKRAAVRSHRG